MAAAFDDVIREFIDFVNLQVGVYMEGLAGFEEFKIVTERQVHRIRRKTGEKMGEDGIPVMVWTSYEDPTQPDVIHHSIVKSDDFIARNSPGGRNEQQHIRSVLVFIFTAWEDSFRKRLADAKKVEVNEIRSDIMGDLRILRHAILHAKAKVRCDEYKRLKVIKDIIKPDEELHISYDQMHAIFVKVKQDTGRLLFEWLGVKEPLVKPEELEDIVLSKGGYGF